MTSETIRLIEKIPLENGCQQWLLETDKIVDVHPGDTLVLGQLKLPVLWRTGKNSLLCIFLNKTHNIDKMHWPEFSFISSSTSQQTDKQHADLTLVLCKNIGLYHALHQLYNWRKQKQLPDNLLLLSETQQNPPFKLQPSRIFSSLVPAEATATIALLDDWGIAARFSNQHWQPGCFEGTIDELEKLIVEKYHSNSIRKLYFN